MKLKFFIRIYLKYRIILLLFLLFFISRVFFINTQGVFFDSKEYFNLLSFSNYLIAIINGHFPPHEGYILLYWPIFHLASFLHLDGTYFVILGQIIFSFITLLCFYEFITFIADKKTALYATILAALIPLIWIINVTLMMENAYTTYFFVSLFLFTRYLKSKKQLFLHLSMLFFCLALLTETMVVLWTPLYLLSAFYKSKNLLPKIIFYFIIYIGVFSLGNIYMIASIKQMEFQTIFFLFYLGKVTEFASLHFDFKSLLIVIRNFLIPLLRNNTIFLVVLSSISLLSLFNKNKKLLLFGILWILPAIFTNQWWDALFAGRHGLLASFGISFLTAYLLRNKNFLFVILCCYLLLVSLPALNLLRKPIPYLVEADYVGTLPKNGYLIESHFARPQIQDTYKGKYFSVNEPVLNKSALPNIINQYIKANKPVYISSAAISEPYGLYAGPYLHSVTLSYANPFSLGSILTHFTIKPYKVINSQDNLIMYKIISAKPSQYPLVKKLRNSNRRLDYYDPFWQISWWIETTFWHQ